MNRAAVHPGHFQFCTFRVMQIQIRLHAPKVARDIVHDLIDQLIEIENGRDLVRPLLQLEQIFNLLEVHGTTGCGIGEGGSWTCSHGMVSFANS